MDHVEGSLQIMRVPWLVASTVGFQVSVFSVPGLGVLRWWRLSVGGSVV